GSLRGRVAVVGAAHRAALGDHRPEGVPAPLLAVGLIEGLPARCVVARDVEALLGAPTSLEAHPDLVGDRIGLATGDVTVLFLLDLGDPRLELLLGLAGRGRDDLAVAEAVSQVSPGNPAQQGAGRDGGDVAVAVLALADAGDDVVRGVADHVVVVLHRAAAHAVA